MVTSNTTTVWGCWKHFAHMAFCGVMCLWLSGWLAGAARAAEPAGNAHSALIVVDVQQCFIEGGSLAVSRGSEVVPVINALVERFANVIVTQDWHPPGHVSFASSHLGRKPFEVVDLQYGKQVLWPAHCVQGTQGAELAPGLKVDKAQLVIRKGYHHDIDSYSAFQEADRKTRTGLAGYLRERGIQRIYVAGLATDFCVAWTALDARQAGFEVYVIEDASRGIDLDGSMAKAWKSLQGAGVHRIQSPDVRL